MYTWHILCVILVVYTLKQNNICFWVFEHVLYFCMCLCVIFKGGWLAYFSLQLLITSFYHTASFSTHLMPCVCLHICMCLHVNVVMCTYALSGQSHGCVKAQIYLRLTCGPGSRQPLAVEARPETKCPAFFPLSQMTLLTDLTVSTSLSPGRPPPPLPPTITTTHSSLSWLTGLGYTTATVTSRLLGWVCVCVCLCGASEP